MFGEQEPENARGSSPSIPALLLKSGRQRVIYDLPSDLPDGRTTPPPAPPHHVKRLCSYGLSSRSYLVLLPASWASDITFHFTVIKWMLLIRAESADRFPCVRHYSKRFLCVNLIGSTQQPSLPYPHLTNDKSEVQDQ